MKHKSQVMISSYKQCRNQVNTLNVTLKRQYFSDKILQQKGNMKESWQTINQLLNKRSKSTNIYSLRDSSQTLFDKQRISDKMNQFFCSVGKTLAEDIDVPLIRFCQENLVSTMAGRSLTLGQLTKETSKKQWQR